MTSAALSPVHAALKQVSGSSRKRGNTPTRLIKIVVTDDQGRYLVPDLPKATYDVWVRGYGLVDSPKDKATPGKAVNLTAIAAPNKKAAAAYLSGSVLAVAAAVAAEERLSRNRTSGQRHLAEHKSQGEWIRNVVNTDGCTAAINWAKATREIPKALGSIREFSWTHGTGEFSPVKPAAG